MYVQKQISQPRSKVTKIMAMSYYEVIISNNTSSNET
jgi:hypothetical protein